MLPVTITDLDAMTRYLDALLGPQRVAGLTSSEIEYLASLAYERLPEAPEDDIAALLRRHEASCLARAQARLAAIGRARQVGTAPQPRPTNCRSVDQAVTQHSFLDEEQQGQPTLIGQT